MGIIQQHHNSAALSLLMGGFIRVVQYFKAKQTFLGNEHGVLVFDQDLGVLAEVSGRKCQSHTLGSLLHVSL